MGEGLGPPNSQVFPQALVLERGVVLRTSQAVPVKWPGNGGQGEVPGSYKNPCGDPVPSGYLSLYWLV